MMFLLSIASSIASISAAPSAALFVQPIRPSSFISRTKTARRVAKHQAVIVTPVFADNVKVKKLSTYPGIPDELVNCFSPEEWEQRCSLAVSYRIAYLHEWHENIFNHITLKVAGSDDEPDGPYFLLNDYGLGFDEITACNLLKVNLDVC